MANYHVTCDRCAAVSDDCMIINDQYVCPACVCRPLTRSEQDALREALKSCTVLVAKGRKRNYG